MAAYNAVKLFDVSKIITPCFPAMSTYLPSIRPIGLREMICAYKS